MSVGWPRKNWNTLYLTIASTICIVCQWYLVHDIIWLIALCGENCMHIGQHLFKWQRIKNHMSKHAMPESQVSVTYLFQLRRWSMWPPFCSHTALKSLFEWPDWLPDFFQSNSLPLFPNFLLQFVLCEFLCAFRSLEISRCSTCVSQVGPPGTRSFPLRRPYCHH